MAWTAPRTWVTGETVTAALMNTHVRDNLLSTGVAKVTTAGDMVYATGATAVARLGIGSANQLVRVNAGATAPEWASTLSGLTLTAPAISQVAFPATQVPSADANTLDDYEEGTWTPTVTFGGAAVGVAYAAQTGRYTKIGNRVTISGNMTLSNKGSSVGNAVIAGLPFTAGAACAVTMFLQATAFANQAEALITGVVATITLYEVTEAGTLSTITDADFTNNSDFFVMTVYSV